MRFYRHWDLLPSSWPSSGTFPIMVLCIGSGTHDLSCVLLLVTQAGVGWLCSRKGRDRWQPKGLPHPLSGDFCRPGYGGTDVLYRLGCESYVIACAILCLPVVYFLCSVAALVVYDLSLLYWTASGGPLNTFGGTGLLWLLLLLAVPFYNTLINLRDERRLAVFRGS